MWTEVAGRSVYVCVCYCPAMLGLATYSFLKSLVFLTNEITCKQNKKLCYVKLFLINQLCLKKFTIENKCYGKTDSIWGSSNTYSGKSFEVNCFITPIFSLHSFFHFLSVEVIFFWNYFWSSHWFYLHLEYTSISQVWYYSLLWLSTQLKSLYMSHWGKIWRNR